MKRLHSPPEPPGNLLVLALGIMFLYSSFSCAEELERTTLAMGTRLRVRIQARSRRAALAGSELAMDAIRRAESRLSNWREDSEVSRLNKTPVGTAFPMSTALQAEWKAAEECRRLTDGAFDTRLGALVDLWDLRGEGRRPKAREISAYLESQGKAGLEWVDNAVIRRHEFVLLATGGFGKGAALDRVGAALKQSEGVSGVWLNLGGQITQWGWSSELSIALAHPWRRDTTILSFSSPEGSISTSGNSERGIEVDGQGYGHLLDPRTGLSAEDFGSVTVWAESSLLADCLSTGLFVMGPQEGQAWWANHPEVEVIWLESHPLGIRVTATSGWRGRISDLAEDVSLSFINLN